MIACCNGGVVRTVLSRLCVYTVSRLCTVGAQLGSEVSLAPTPAPRGGGGASSAAEWSTVSHGEREVNVSLHIPLWRAPPSSTSQASALAQQPVHPAAGIGGGHGARRARRAPVAISRARLGAHQALDGHP